MKIRLFSLLFSGLLLSGCGQLTPRAEPIEPPGFALEEASRDFIKTEYLPENWWSLYNDAQLSYMIEVALARNPSLQSAQSKIETAAANANRMRAALFPSLTWGGDVSRQKFSETGIIPFGPNPQATPGGSGLPATGGAGGIPVYFTQYETELSLNYDFDLWGKNRNLLAAAAGEVQAAAADAIFTRLNLAVAIARVYFDLQIQFQRLHIAQAAVKNKEIYLQLTEKRIHSQLGNALQQQIAETNVAQARQTLLQIEEQIAVDEYRLKAYLAGDFTECIHPADVSPESLPAIAVPCDLPLTLIARRPDIIAQLWLIESAGHEIEAAQAGFYPNVNLTAFLGLQTIHFRELLEGRSGFYNIDPAFSLPIFDGGRLQANLWASETRYDQAVYQYNEKILNAAEEVLESLAILQKSQEQLTQLIKSTSYQQKLFQLTTMRVAHHLDSDFNQLDSEILYLNAQDQELLALANSLQASLSLIKALGGGYDISNE